MSDKNEHPESDTPEQPINAPEGTPLDADLSEDELLAALGKQADEVLGVNKFEENQEGEGFANPLEALAAENARQEEEIAGLKDQLLRSVAEMENLRRRTQKDVADARAFSISGFARDMLGVSDNLRRALDHVDEADKEQPSLKTLIEGVELTERELLNGLEKNGVKKLEPKGEKFDANFHQAMFEVPNTEVPNKTVMEVVQVGFVIGERVLRPAMVGVSKGGPKTPAIKEEGEA